MMMLRTVYHSWQILLRVEMFWQQYRQYTILLEQGEIHILDTKQYLSQIERLDRVIQNKLTEIYQLKTMACNIVVSTENERVQTSGDKERMASTVAKIVDIEKEIDSLIDVQIERKNTIIRQIEGIEDNDMYHILFNRYVKRANFNEIAKEMSYSERHILTLHGQALLEFDKKYGSLYRDIEKCS